MKSEELLRAFDDVDEKFLKLVETQASGKKQKKHMSMAWKVAGIAACLALVVGVFAMTGGGAKTLASGWTGLRNLFLGHGTPETTQVPEESGVTLASEGQVSVEPEVTPYADHNYVNGTMISLAGYYGCAEAMATSEWQEFLDGYDQDHEILYAADKTWVSPEGYGEYFIYSTEMLEKFKEIVGKYNLKLHQNIEFVYGEEIGNKLGVKFWDERCHLYSGYMYEDGAFQMDADYYATGGRAYGYQFRRNMKGVFDEVILNIGFVDDYKEWNYVTKDGAEVMLALSGYKGLVFGDYENCCIAINVLNGTEGGLTKEDLEMIADSHHLSLLQ